MVFGWEEVEKWSQEAEKQRTERKTQYNFIHTSRDWFDSELTHLLRTFLVSKNKMVETHECKTGP